jgi:aspartyl-tRNA(Asn)/glutamyl-tRNA(Gln) amidotransferase subunit B
LTIDEDTVKSIRRSLVELPEARRARFAQQYALSEYDAAVLTSTRALADFFEQTATACRQPKAAANWIMGDLLRKLKDAGVDTKDLSSSRVTPSALADMILLVENGTISGKTAKTVFEEMYATRQPASAIVRERGLMQISDSGEIERIIDRIIAENAKTVEQYRAGKSGLIGFFVGQVMKATDGRANPQTVNELLRKMLAG